jgi:Na+/melibiose symporter-like transporter
MNQGVAYSRWDVLSYGLFGLPLALVALPVYVLVPPLYAGSLGLSLTTVGLVLLAARLLDAFVDPLLGRWIDRRSRGYSDFIVLSLPLLAVGFLMLLHPPPLAPGALGMWFATSLVLVYLGYSLASIAHNSWGAGLTQQRGERSRITAAREGWALLGVLIAAALPALAGLAALSASFVLMLGMSAWVLLRYAPRAQHNSDALTPTHYLQPLRGQRFRWLFAVFAVNGIAAAIPATLFLFFASDRLQLANYAGLFLILYFAAAALALPLWTRLAGRIGEARTWRLSMLVAIAAFAWTWSLGSGALIGFALICILSGAALGADLALPPALLAGVIHEAGDSGKHEGAYFGLWSWMTKMNLALAAGISLPLLEWLGYVPGSSDLAGMQALDMAYAVVPCLLKMCAALLLWRAPLDEI